MKAYDAASWTGAPTAGAPPAVGGGGAPPARRRRLAAAFEARHQVVLACFLATLCAYVERTGFSIALTAMAAAEGVGERAQGAALSAFYWGYALSQVPGGAAALRFGGDAVLAASFACWSVASLLTPARAGGAGRMAAARVAVGVAQGFLIPSVHTVLARWVPPRDRARAVSLATSGMYLGSAAAMAALPAVAAARGPAAIPRLAAVLGFAWLIFWRTTLRRVAAERAAHALPSSNGLARSSSSTALARPAPTPPRGAAGRPGATPWAAMLRAPAVWAIVVANFSFHYVFFLVMNWLPAYFTHVLHADLATLGVAYKALPYLAMFAASNAGGAAGDWLVRARGLPVAAARKAINAAGFAAAAAALLAMPGARSLGGGVAAATAALAAAGFARGGFSVNHMDIAPRYAGVLMGISNTAGTLAGVVGVSATGRALQAAGGAAQLAGWHAAMRAAVFQCAVGAGVFAAFARGERLFGGDVGGAADAA